MDEPLNQKHAPLATQDQQTLAALRRGQWTAMEGLVLRYQDRLYATIFRIVNNPDDAADLVQETFVKALQNIAKFEGKSSLYTWLFRIAFNLAVSHKRSLRYRSAASLDGPPDDGALNTQAAGLRRELAQETENDPADDAALRMDHQQVLAALQNLDPDARAIIVLRDVEDCDYEQIAHIMDVPVGTVKSRLFRARVALRDAVLKARESPTARRMA